MTHRFIFLLWSWAALSAGQNTADLTTVLQRAEDYVANYEATLGNMIATEDYVQNSRWTIGRMEVRQTSSDFLIIRVGPRWVGLRDVNAVDGKEVRADTARLDQAFGNSPADNLRVFNRIKSASTRYNIGDFLRDTNVPTFGLQVLDRDQFPHFSFVLDGIENDDGIPVWRVRFTESKGHTLVRNANGKDLRSTGMLWIEAANGRVLKTQFSVENRLVKPPIRSTMVSIFAKAEDGDALVPKKMTEHYESRDNTVDCEAEYSNFRSFHVDIKLDFNRPE